MGTPATPELDKQLEVIHSGRSTTVQEFYDWLVTERSIVLCTYREWDEYDEPQLTPCYISPEQLLADFFGIDRDKIEQERRALLDHIREANADG